MRNKYLFGVVRMGTQFSLLFWLLGNVIYCKLNDVKALQGPFPAVLYVLTLHWPAPAFKVVLGVMEHVASPFAQPTALAVYHC